MNSRMKWGTSTLRWYLQERFCRESGASIMQQPFDGPEYLSKDGSYGDESRRLTGAAGHSILTG